MLTRAHSSGGGSPVTGEHSASQRERIGRRRQVDGPRGLVLREMSRSQEGGHVRLHSRDGPRAVEAQAGGRGGRTPPRARTCSTGQEAPDALLLRRVRGAGQEAVWRGRHVTHIPRLGLSGTRPQHPELKVQLPVPRLLTLGDSGPRVEFPGSEAASPNSPGLF